MKVLEIFLLAVGLSMDSLAASTAGGAVLQNFQMRSVVKIASFMAFFQAGLTFVGFWFGGSFSRYITTYDHWVAFALLLYLGGRMIYEGFRNNGGNCTKKTFNLTENKTLVGMALATSVDAWAVGVSMALLGMPILMPALVIGVVTFAFSAVGVYFGHKFGGKTRVNLNLLGGLILIVIGIRILVSHLFF